MSEKEMAGLPVSEYDLFSMSAAGKDGSVRRREIIARGSRELALARRNTDTRFRARFVQVCGEYVEEWRVFCESEGQT